MGALDSTLPRFGRPGCHKFDAFGMFRYKTVQPQKVHSDRTYLSARPSFGTGSMHNSAAKPSTTKDLMKHCGGKG